MRLYLTLPVRCRARRDGVALVIVLAFVLLLTGVVLAFFSRSLSERQISNSGVNQVKVDVLGRGAIDTVVGDLQDEIAAGSNAYVLPSPTPSQGSATLFIPTNAATMVPAPVLPSPAPSATPLGLENLVKQSAGGQPFYQNPKGTSYYNVTNYKPTARAAASTSGTGADGDNSTAKPSLSGRFISSARWNKPLLLPATSATDATPVINSGTFVPPDWVVLARDGSNATVWNNNLRTSNAGTTAAVGRFAYNIYDEGGLLDANVAGYPAGAYPADTSTPAPLPLPTPPTRKSSLAYADLTVPVTLPGGAMQPMMTAREINALVGWRNYASSQPSGSFPNYTPAPTPSSGFSPFDLVALFSTNGNLAVQNTKLYGNQSDRMFGSRQQLIDFLLQGVATGDPERVTLQNSLLYLSTFSRGLNQPSFIKTHSDHSERVLGYTPTAPAVLPPAQGGSNANGLDSLINPSFLAVRVKTTSPPNGGRFDGSNLIAGEPLVKKRFPLNRLAWLTYVGPITLDGSTYNPKLDPSYVTTLKQTYRFTDAFLLQGTDANIRTSFGLTWGGVNWAYNIHNRDGSTGPIRKLDSPTDTTDVLRASPGREADFFELLKASINVGSLAKTATDPNQTTLPGGSQGTYALQYLDDSSVDSAVIQIGANIIDQFDVDSYPTWIKFNDGGSVTGRDIYGAENLPYIAGLSHALVKVKQADPTLQTVTINNAPTPILTNTGVGVLLQCPELWNPYDYNVNNLPQSTGVAGPAKFRIYAMSGNVANVNSAIQIYGYLRTGSSNGHNVTGATVAKSPGYQTPYGFSFAAPESRSLTQANTELDFEVSRDATGITRFREPTILCAPTAYGGYVTGSPAVNKLGIISNPSCGGFFLGSAFRSDVGSGTSAAPPIAGNGYVGFYLGAVPLYWSDGQAAGSPAVYLDNAGMAGTPEVHYYLQYQDASGTWVTYDEKYRTLGGGGSYSENGTLSGGGDKSPAAYGWSSFFYPRVNNANGGQWDSSFAAMDPRTSRFHLMKFTSGNARYWAYPPYSAAYGAPLNDPSMIASRPGTTTGTTSTVGFTFGWVDPNKTITLPLRSGTNDGSSFFCPVGLFPGSMGWNPGSVGVGAAQSFVTYNSLTLGTVTGLHICRPGMFAQNTPYLRRNDRPLGDTGDSGAMDGTFAPPPGPSNAAQCYSDPDGVVRRATGGLVPYGTNGPPATSDVGLPMTVANTGGITRLSQSDSRPVILNRPFRTVGELAYTFAGTPWKNLNFSMPESGDSALLDVFSINDTDDANGLVAGKVNLNTRQAPVLQAILAGAYKDEFNPGTAPLSGALPSAVAAGLVSRTTSTAANKGPLQNVSELVGKFVSRVDANTDTAMGGIAAATKNTTISPHSYDGFSADLVNNLPPLPPASSPTAPSGILVTNADLNLSIPRFANATVRALAASGQTRVWNLLLDVIAQTGRYPQSAASLDKFSVEGEQRYWVHLAIDRFTGQVIDRQIEVVKE